MSIKIMARVWDSSKATGTALLLLLSLADSANDDGYCWPGTKRLMQRCRIKSRATLYRALDALRGYGELEWIGGKTNGRSNRYRVLIGVQILDQGGVPKLYTGVQILDQGGVHTGVQEPSIKPSKKPKREPSIPADAATSTAAPRVSPEVLSIYQNNIGLPTPVILDDLEQAERTYSAAWVVEALKETARARVKRFAYTQKILANWQANGYKADRPELHRPAANGNASNGSVSKADYMTRALERMKQNGVKFDD